jgi:hypothetical protein
MEKISHNFFIRSSETNLPQVKTKCFSTTTSNQNPNSIMADEVYDGAIGIDLGKSQLSIPSVACTVESCANNC